MTKTLKFYLFMAFILGLSSAGLAVTPVSNYYENTVATNVCEGDSNIIKAGCSVAVGQVVRVTPGILTGVTIDKMGTCFDKYKTTNENRETAVIDLNDPCNQIAMFNPEMKKENYAYIQPNDEEITKQSRGGFTAFTTHMEIFGKNATSGKMLMDREYYAAKTFKEVPILGTALAQSTPSAGAGVVKIKDFVFNVWQLSRNIAYLILLLTSLGLGIYIMGGFTDKDGKIKLTVERAIPRVVIAVVLISSSYWIGELVLTSLLGQGLIQGFAAFLSQALFTSSPISTSPFESQFWLGFPASIMVMAVVSVILTTIASGGSLVVVLVFAIAAAVWRIFVVNFLILKNIFDLMIYIIYSPFIIVGGVSPSDNNGQAFRNYGAKMLKFIAVGFMLSLINYGSKALLAYSVLQPTAAEDAKIFGSFGALYGNGGLSWTIVYIVGLVAYIYILYLADKVEETAENFVKNLTGIGKTKKSN